MAERVPDSWLWKEHRIPRVLEIMGNGLIELGNGLPMVFAHRRVANLNNLVNYWKKRGMR